MPTVWMIIGPIVLVALTLAQGGLAWLMWSMKKEFATKSELSKVDADVKEVLIRVTQVEQEVKHLPTRAELHALALALKDFGGDLKAARSDMSNLRGLVQRAENTITRHEQIFSDAARKS